MIKLITGTCYTMNVQFMPGCDGAIGQPQPLDIIIILKVQLQWHANLFWQILEH